MMNTFIIAFIVMEIFMLSAFLPLIKKIDYYFSSRGAAKRFKNLVLTVCLYFFIDAIWALVVYAKLSRSILLLHILSMIDFLCLGFIPYLWFLYVEEILGKRYYITCLPRYIYKTIMATYTLLIITSFKTGYIYTMSSKCIIIWGPYTNKILLTLIVIFLGSATIHGIYSFITSKNKIIMKKSIMVVVFIIPILLVLFLYEKYRMAICVPTAIFTSISLYFFCQEDQRSYIDNLTGLFNRKKLQVFSEEIELSFLEGFRNQIYYIDINKFKNINDTYGHSEGDRVLKIVANALKKIDNRYNSNSIRIGGDEFIIIVREDSIKGINFKAIIQTEISKIEKEERLPYKIGVSIGKSCYDNKEKTIESCLKEADLDMYKEKHNTTI